MAKIELVNYHKPLFVISSLIFQQTKRWKGQWTYCFNLDFWASVDDDDEALEACVVKFVTDVIAMSKSPCIKKFQFESYSYYESHVTTWVDSIIRRNVEGIYLDAASDIEYPVTLPQSLFTCQTLVSLEIVSHAIYDISPSVNLLSLKVFSVSLYDPSDAVTTTLFCGMPVLEDLLVYISLSDDEEVTLHIFTPSLKRLELSLLDGF